MKYYLVIKRNEKLLHATTWMNLEYSKLNERSQTQKAIYAIIPFLQNVQNRQIQRDRKNISGCQRLWGGGKWDC